MLSDTLIMGSLMLSAQGNFGQLVRVPHRIARRAAEIDEWRMDALRRNRPDLVQVELDFYASRNKKRQSSSDVAGPSSAASPCQKTGDDSDSSFDSSFWDSSSSSDFDFGPP